MRRALAVALLLYWAGGTVVAEIRPITDVDAGVNGSPPYLLQSVTAGGRTFSIDQLATGVSTGDAQSGTQISAADDFDLNHIAARDNPPGGPIWKVTTFDGQATWSDTNGDAADFFVFEAGGNDDLELRAILARGALGQTVHVSKSTWGDTGFDKVGSPNGGQSIGGIAFAVTDLLDASGTPLTNDSEIEGVQISSPGVDPSCFCAVVSAVANRPPQVEVFADRVIARPNSRVYLEGRVTDDGLGDPNGYLSWQWSLVNGPDAVVFVTNVFAASASVKLPSAAGTYVIQLLATDGQWSKSASVSIVVPDLMVGDLNADGRVDGLDLLSLGQEWLVTPRSAVDCDGDDQVNLVDLAWLANDWRTGGPSLVINEFLSSNLSTNPKDPQGEYEDWIELYNATEAVIDVEGMYLTDNFNDPTKWRIRAVGSATTVIAPGGYLVIWADEDGGDAGLHANFKLDSGGEQIGLFDRNGVTRIDSVVFGEQTRDVSFGRDPDGSDHWVTLAPTAGASNDDSYVGVVADTKFSTDRGFFEEPFFVQITTATAGATIVYTTDGSAPTPSYGTRYVEPLRVETTTVLRAMAYKPGRRPTNVDTQTYIFLDDVIRQPADVPGYPRPNTWLGGSGYAYHDYEMDPEIVNDPAYSGMIKDALKAIPTLCISTDKDHLNTFYWGNGESPCSIELIHPDDPNKNVQTDCGVEPHSHNRMKRSLRLNFRSQFGDAKLKSSIFQDAPLNGDGVSDSIDKIVLRGGNNRCWARVWNPRETTYTMDQWYRDTQIVMSGVGSRGAFVHLYINGLYWGLYNPVERPDGAFAAEYHGGEKEDWYSVSHGGPHGGNAARFNYLKGALKDKDMSSPANYAEIHQYLDIEKYIDYVMLTWFIGMTDWPQNNWWGANRNEPMGPFMYFGWDGEWSWKTTHGHDNGWVHPDFRANKSGGQTIAALWHSLRRSDEFMLLFADRAYKHLFHDGALTDQNCKARYLILNDHIRDAIVGESARWGDTLEGLGHDTYTRDEDWLAAEAQMLGPGFMEGNAARFLSSLRAQGYYPSIDPPVIFPRGGHVAIGSAVSLDNPNAGGAVLYTLDGTDPRSAGQSGPIVLTESRRLKARVLRSGQWSALNEAVFAVGPVAQNLRITEIMYHPKNTGQPGDPNTEFVELRNIGPESINLNLVAFTKGIACAFKSVGLAPGESGVVVGDIGAFRTKYGQGPRVLAQYSGKLDNGGERLRLEDALGRVIHDFEYRDDWHDETDGDGFSLQVQDPSGTDPVDWGDPSTWGPSASIGGSPGTN